VARRENLPVIDDGGLDALRELEKPVPDYDWRSRLLNVWRQGPYLKGRYNLPSKVTVGAHSGTLYLFVRITAALRDDWSVGLAFTDHAQNGPYRLLRCNGYHVSIHRNAMEGDIIPPNTPHVHIATMRYLVARDRWHDGYAVRSDSYSDLNGAIEYLATQVNLVPEGRMLL
jgi:hypothetical protein